MRNKIKGFLLLRKTVKIRKCPKMEERGRKIISKMYKLKREKRMARRSNGKCKVFECKGF